MKRTWFALGCALLMAACDVTEPTGSVAEQVRAERAAWLATGIKDYSYDYRVDCFCQNDGFITITVRNNAVTKAVVKATGQMIASPGGYPTISSFYDDLVSHADHAAELRVEFNHAVHIPLRAVVDPEAEWVDDEAIYTLANFIPR